MSTKLIRTPLREASQSQTEPSKFRVILIQEGLGNLRDCFFYSKDCLKNGPSVFEGKKCFADHPSGFEEEVRPERSTRDILGYFQNVTYEEGADGRGMLTADLLTVEQESFAWAQALLTNSIVYSQKFQESDFVGLSINASGEANEVYIDQFMQSNPNLAPSILPKLQQAQSEGIDVIRVVSQLTEAVSCDLVTEAGAGGRILKLLERNKKPMKRKVREDMGAPAPSAGSAGPKLDGAQPDHADAAQDVALFKSLVQQYLGDGHADDQEAHEMAKHAYQACQAEGMSHEAAMEAAGQHLKMSKKIGEKMKQAHQAECGMKQGHEGHEMEGHHEAHEGHEGENEAHEAGLVGPGVPLGAKGKQAKESAATIAALQGRIAKLEEANNRLEISNYLERKLKESKLPNAVTKRFKESMQSVRSKRDIDVQWTMFMKGYEGASEEVGSSESFLFTEKSFTGANPGRSTEGVISFEDCAE